MNRANIVYYTLFMLILIIPVSALEGPAWALRYLAVKETSLEQAPQVLELPYNQTCNATVNLTTVPRARDILKEEDVWEFVDDDKTHVIKVWSISPRRILYDFDGRLHKTIQPWNDEVWTFLGDVLIKSQHIGSDNILFEHWEYTKGCSD
jgi:hypothetical protein